MKKLQKLNGKKLNKKEQQNINGGGVVLDGDNCRFEGEECFSHNHQGICHELEPGEFVCVAQY